MHTPRSPGDHRRILPYNALEWSNRRLQRWQALDNCNNLPCKLFPKHIDELLHWYVYSIQPEFVMIMTSTVFHTLKPSGTKGNVYVRQCNWFIICFSITTGLRKQESLSVSIATATSTKRSYSHNGISLPKEITTGHVIPERHITTYSTKLLYVAVTQKLQYSPTKCASDATVIWRHHDVITGDSAEIKASRWRLDRVPLMRAGWRSTFQQRREAVDQLTDDQLGELTAIWDRVVWFYLHADYCCGRTAPTSVQQPTNYARQWN